MGETGWTKGVGSRLGPPLQPASFYRPWAVCAVVLTTLCPPAALTGSWWLQHQSPSPDLRPQGDLCRGAVQGLCTHLPTSPTKSTPNSQHKNPASTVTSVAKDPFTLLTQPGTFPAQKGLVLLGNKKIGFL
jgi:hypothetical protein